MTSQAGSPMVYLPLEPHEPSGGRKRFSPGLSFWVLHPFHHMVLPSAVDPEDRASDKGLCARERHGCDCPDVQHLTSAAAMARPWSRPAALQGRKGGHRTAGRRGGTASAPPSASLHSVSENSVTLGNGHFEIFQIEKNICFSKQRMPILCEVAPRLALWRALRAGLPRSGPVCPSASL